VEAKCRGPMGWKDDLRGWGQDQGGSGGGLGGRVRRKGGGEEHGI
jgi:hypothetical protein